MISLLQSKLAIPITRPSLVARSRLHKQLDAIYYHKLVLVSAPAGFGKTTLVANWLQKRNSLPGKNANVPSFSDGLVLRALWLSLSDEDNDPARFIAYFLAALAKVGIEVSLAETAVSAASLNLIMTDVVNAISADMSLENHLVFVLDDYHLINNLAIHEAVTFLLEHMPVSMHLILTTRADPPLPLARWRARSQLVELRQQDLQFSIEETVDFLNRVMNLPLSLDNINVLNQRTEGWVAGLQMAAVSLRGRQDMEDVVHSFGGSHRYILDYLMEEVLFSQPEEIKQFLLHTSVLDRLYAPLCQAVAETPQSQQTLEYLDNANLFILSLDQERRWYRYHRLFSDLLRQRLTQVDSALVPVLHQRAAVWFEENGFVEEAISHALLAGGYSYAATMIEQTAEAMLMRSEQVTFMRWVGQLPEIEMGKRPLLSLFYAYTLILEGHAPTEIEILLQHIKIEDAPGEMALIQSLLAIYSGNSTISIDLAQQALTQIDSNHTFLRGMATWVLGIAYIFFGDLDQGWRTLEQAAQLSQQVGNMTIAVASWGRMANQAWRKGDLYQAKRIYEQALILATDEAERPLPIAGEAYIGLARIHYEWNDLSAALAYAETGIVLSKRWREISSMAGAIWVARIKQALDEPEMAHEALARARHIALKSEGTQFDDMAVAMTEAYLNLLQGNLDGVAAWCAQRQIPDEIDLDALKDRDDIIEGHLRKYEFIILARLRLAQQRPHAALAILLPLQSDIQRLQRHDLQIEIQILISLAYHQLNNYVQAGHYMQKALSLGDKGNFIRTFVDAGAGEVLRGFKNKDSETKAYLQTLLVACGQQATQPANNNRSRQAAHSSLLVEPLSNRELEILTLIAEGLSNREIANELVLSLPTIKWHTSNIYGKLGVRNRTTAVARARELQILK